MVKKRTVLILGAGASKPYGFPLGVELRDSIIRIKDIHFECKRLGLDYESYSEFTKALAHSGFSSVDAYLEEHEEWLEIGKAAIALNLIKVEVNTISNLFPPKQPKDHWYETLWSHLKRPSWKGFMANKIAVVTFNYDRSLEHYLVTVLCNTYNIRPEIAAKGLKSFPILHVHGLLGDYTDKKGSRNFGFSLIGPTARERFMAATSGIQIVHENKGDTPDFFQAQELIRNAEKVIFIGFGFHPKNMNKLGLREVRQYNYYSGETLKLVGTHKGIKAREWDRICYRYGFPYLARKYGTGSISEFLNEWLY